MAVSKLWSVTSRLGQVIDYAANPEKTAADIYTEEQYQALRDVLSYAKDEEKKEILFVQKSKLAIVFCSFPRLISFGSTFLSRNNELSSYRHFGRRY